MAEVDWGATWAAAKSGTPSSGFTYKATTSSGGGTSGGTSGGTTSGTTKTEGKNLLGNLIAKLLSDVAQNKQGAYSAIQQEAASRAFVESGIRTLDVTPKAAWDKINHPGVSDYYWGEMKNMVASGRTDPEMGAKSILGLQAEWTRRAERSPYMTYPSGGVAAGKAHIAPYLEAGGLVSSPSYIADNPEYADYMYDKDPEYADRVLANLRIPGVGYTYGGIDERVRSDFERAYKNLSEAKARHTAPPWMQAMGTPIGTLPSWVQPVGTTVPRW